MRLQFETEDPPRVAPPGAHPSIWRLAWQVHNDHQPAADGWCTVCREPRELWPCKPAGSARRGLLLALHLQNLTVGSRGGDHPRPEAIMSTEPPAAHPPWCTREAAELDQGSHIAAWVDLGDTTARVRARVRLHLYWPDTGMPDGAGGVEVELAEDGAMYDSWLTRQQAQALYDALGVMLQQAGTP